MWRHSKWLILLAASSLILTGCAPLDKTNKAGLQIITNNQPASVFVNDQYFEKSPLIERNLKPGEYTVRLEFDDTTLAPMESPITLHRGTVSVITWIPGKTAEESGGVIYELEPLGDSTQAELYFLSAPDGVVLTLDGTERQFAPATFKVSPGNHEYEAVLPAFQTHKNVVQAVAGHRVIANLKLAREVGEPTTTPKLPNALVSPPANISPLPITISATYSATASPSAQLVRIGRTNYFRDGAEVLRVRDAPSAAGAEIGLVSVGASFPVLSVEQNGWIQIQFGDKSGWVNTQYIVR